MVSDYDRYLKSVSDDSFNGYLIIIESQAWEDFMV